VPTEKLDPAERNPAPFTEIDEDAGMVSVVAASRVNDETEVGQLNVPPKEIAAVV